MKDKLYKTHHKAMYYVCRNTLISISLFICCGALVAIPTYFSLNTQKLEKGKATEECVIEDRVGDQDGKEEISYFNY